MNSLILLTQSSVNLNNSVSIKLNVFLTILLVLAIIAVALDRFALKTIKNKINEDISLYKVNRLIRVLSVRSNSSTNIEFGWGYLAFGDKSIFVSCLHPTRSTILSSNEDELRQKTFQTKLPIVSKIDIESDNLYLYTTNNFSKEI